MLSDELNTAIDSLQLEIAENEKNFDAALQNRPTQLELARTIYKQIKVLEGRLADLKTQLSQKPGS